MNGHTNKVQISSSNDAVLRRVNRGITLKATRFADDLLSGVFRAIFRVEQSYEFAEPEIYELEHEPQRIMWNRLDDWWAGHIPEAIATERLLAARYHQFREYDFIVVADISHSMMLRWWDTYGGKTLGEPTSLDNPKFKWQVAGDKTKLFLLKYIMTAFLRAATANEFFSVGIFFGGGAVNSYHSRQEPHLEEFLIQRIDRHYERHVSNISGGGGLLPEALRRVLSRRRRSIVLCISDFMDTLQHMNEKEPMLSFDEVMLPLAEIASHHRLIVLRINEKFELFPEVDPDGTADILDNECYSGERPIPKGGRLKGYPLQRVLKHGERVKRWQKDLDDAFSRYGIRTQQIVAQRDDEQVDRIIYNLGAQT